MNNLLSFGGGWCVGMATALAIIVIIGFTNKKTKP